MNRPVKESLLGMADRIRAAVHAVGTQADAASAIGVTVQQVRRYVSGRSRAPVAALARLASASGYRLEFLLSGEGERFSGQARRVVAGSGEEAALITSSRSALALAAKEDPVFAEAKRRMDEITGGEDALEVRQMLRKEGLLLLAFGPELVALPADMPTYQRQLEGETVAAILREERTHWPMLARVAVASQRALLTYVAPHLPSPAAEAPDEP